MIPERWVIVFISSFAGGCRASNWSILLDELRLPTFHEPARSGEVESQDTPELDDIDRIGLRADLNLEETMVQSLCATAVSGAFSNTTWTSSRTPGTSSRTPTTFQNNRSVEIYVLDISGSMRGEYFSLVRKTIFILWHYLERRYPTNLRRYVVFQDVAEEKTRDEFFCVESNGGAHISMGFEKAVELLEGVTEYDKCLFIFTDGETSSDDFDLAEKRFEEALSAFDLVSYGHVNPGGRGIGGFSEYVQGAAKTREGAVFANLVDLETIRSAMKDVLAFFNAGGPAIRRRPTLNTVR